VRLEVFVLLARRTRSGAVHGLPATWSVFTIISLLCGGRTESSLSTDRFSLFNLHDFLHNTIFHQVVDPGAVNGLPVLNPLF